MKKLVAIISTAFVGLSVIAQSVTSLSVIPANPSANDNVQVVATTSFPGGPCSLFSSFNPTRSNDTVIVEGIYCYQGSSGGCTSTDTFSAGVFAAGDYVVRFRLTSTNTAGPCGSLSFALKDIEIHNFTVGNGTTGVEDVKNELVSAYPSPASDAVNFSFGENVQDAEISIHDISGALVQTMTIGGASLKMDVSGFPAGIYFYTVASAKKSVSGKLVIAH